MRLGVRLLSRGRKAKSPVGGAKGLGKEGGNSPAQSLIERPSVPNAAGIVSGVPDALCRPSFAEDGPRRRVYVSHATRPATQSGLLHRWAARPWRIEFDRGLVGQRWTNPLMGWVSGGDAMQALSITGFAKAEDAVRFAEAQGWQPVVQEDLSPDREDIAPKSYADNFAYSDSDPKIVRTK